MPTKPQFKLTQMKTTEEWCNEPQITRITLTAQEVDAYHYGVSLFELSEKCENIRAIEFQHPAGSHWRIERIVNISEVAY